MEFNRIILLEGPTELITFFKSKDLLLTQFLFFSSLFDYHKQYGPSRGSFLVSRKHLNPSINEHLMVLPNKLALFHFIKNDLDLSDKIQTVCWTKNRLEIRWIKVREIPKTDEWFETVWKDYNDGKIFQ
jgi:hypothetical protein